MSHKQCLDLCFFRTLLKQGMYGGKPPVKRVLVVTPGSLVKVSFLQKIQTEFFAVVMQCMLKQVLAQNCFVIFP